MEKSNISSALVKSILLCVLAAIVIGGVYFVLTRNRKSQTEETYVATVVDEFTTMNLEKNYPASSRKVVELYIRTMQTLYKEEYTKEQEQKMIDLLRGIMDDELLANNPNFDKEIRDEVQRKKEEDNTISNYEILQKKEPAEYLLDGRVMCKIDCIYYMRMGTQGTITVDYVFALRRDELTGNWKIYGWAVKESQ